MCVFRIPCNSCIGGLFVLLTCAVGLIYISELLHGAVNLRTCWHGQNPQKALGFRIHVSMFTIQLPEIKKYIRH